MGSPMEKCMVADDFLHVLQWKNYKIKKTDSENKAEKWDGNFGGGGLSEVTADNFHHRLIIIIFDFGYLGIESQLENLDFVTIWHLFSSNYVENLIKIGQVVSEKSHLYNTTFE